MQKEDWKEFSYGKEPEPELEICSDCERLWAERQESNEECKICGGNIIIENAK